MRYVEMISSAQVKSSQATGANRPHLTHEGRTPSVGKLQFWQNKEIDRANQRTTTKKHADLR